MSATCRPAAVTAIKKSLELEDHNLEVITGELTRPEIQIIQVPMEHSISLCNNLNNLFASKFDVPNVQVCGNKFDLQRDL